MPANGPDGVRLCARCGGITEVLRCHGCGADDDLYLPSRCRRCRLHDHLQRLFDDGTGHINAALVPLVDAVGAMAVPRGGLSWLHKPATAERIRAIATAAVPLTHDGIDQLPASNGREHLRELLVAHGILPARNRHLAAYERWAANRLATIDEPTDRRLVAAFLRWHHRPRLERLAADGELTESRYSTTRAQTNIAVRLLGWLRGRGTELTSCTQADVDAWFAHGPGARVHARSFLRWAMRTRRCPPLELPPDRGGTPRAIPESQRLELLHRVLNDDSIDLVDRVAGCLVLLYALPTSRIHRLRLTDLHATDDGLALRLGDDLLPVPEPAAGLIDQLAADRRNLSGAEHPNCDWLFPGRRAGHPIEGEQLSERLNRLGINRGARTAALNALLGQVPAPVLAKMLDRRPWRVSDRAKVLGTDWASYAALKARQ